MASERKYAFMSVNFSGEVALRWLIQARARACVCVCVCVCVYTGCNRRNGPDFWRVFLRSYYTDTTQNTYIQSSMFTEILAREV